MRLTAGIILSIFLIGSILISPVSGEETTRAAQFTDTSNITTLSYPDGTYYVIAVGGGGGGGYGGYPVYNYWGENVSNGVANGTVLVTPVEPDNSPVGLALLFMFIFGGAMIMVSIAKHLSITRQEPETPELRQEPAPVQPQEQELSDGTTIKEIVKQTRYSIIDSLDTENPETKD